MTWSDAAKLTQGERIVFTRDWDVFPIAIVPAGRLATVQYNDGAGTIWVLPDDKVLQEAFEAWDGDIQLSAEMDGMGKGVNADSTIRLADDNDEFRLGT